MAGISNQPQDDSSTMDVTGTIETAFKVWERYNFRDLDLWESFREDFKGFKEDDFKQTSIHCQRKLREFLRKRGVWVERSKLTIARSLFNTLQEDENPPWTEAEVKEFMKKEEFNSYQIKELLDTDFGRKPRAFAWQIQASPPHPLQPDTGPPMAFDPTTGHSFPSLPAPPGLQHTGSSLPPPTATIPPLPNSPTPVPQRPPHPNPSQPLPVNITGYGRELSNLAKLYTDEAKYSGENDSFDFKLTVFHDMCARADVPPGAKLKALPTMLKGLALDYYYSNVSSSRIPVTFDGACYAIQAYFEGAEYRRSVLSRWNGITLKSVVGKTENEGKSMEECLQLLIKDLRHLQHGLDPEFRTDKFIHNKLINACQETPACQYACFKPSDTLAGLINDLQSSIITFQKANPSEIFFTDRRYYKYPENPRTSRFQPRTFQPRTSSNRDTAKKKCFVCDKEGCWSSKHTKDEREESRKRYKERIGPYFSRRFDKHPAHYIADYEGEESDSDNDVDDEMEALMIDVPSPTLSDAKAKDSESFITSFGSVEPC